MFAQREIVIVGGGLVGCTLAIALSRRGVPSTILERSAAVPDVLRGELIMPAAVDVLDRLGIGSALRRVALETEGVALHHPAFDGGRCQVDYGLAPRPFDVDQGTPARGLCGFRQDLYETLWREAERCPQVEIVREFDVRAVERLADRRLRVTSRTGGSFVARMVVAADGARSRCRRSMGFPAIDEEAQTVVQGFVGAAPRYRRRHVEVGIHPLGAAFVFPFPGGRFRSTIEYQATFREDFRTADPLQTHLTVLAEALPRVFEELGGPSIEVCSDLGVQPSRPTKLSSVVDDGFALAGDAAGVLDPFSGYGMTLAILDAEDLAETLGEAFAHDVWDARLLRGYEARRAARVSPKRQATEEMAYIFLDKAEGFADPLAEKLARRWSDRELIGPIVATEFAGYPPLVPASVGLRSHVMGLV